MGNIVRWFEDFPNRALELMQEIEPVAARRDRLGSLSLLIAPALLTAPYERLQTYARRTNPQADFLQFSDAHLEFDRVMLSPFGQAAFWTERTRATTFEWRCSEVVHNIATPQSWQTVDGRQPSEDGFWSDSIVRWQTRRVWKALRDSLAHWNVVTSDRDYRTFDESGTMEQFLLYRSDSDAGPWDVIAVSPEAFFSFLKSWAEFLSHGFAHEVLVASAEG
jgi:hypothetical protein